MRTGTDISTPRPPVAKLFLAARLLALVAGLSFFSLALLTLVAGLSFFSLALLALVASLGFFSLTLLALVAGLSLLLVTNLHLRSASRATFANLTFELAVIGTAIRASNLLSLTTLFLVFSTSLAISLSRHTRPYEGESQC